MKGAIMAALLNIPDKIACALLCYYGYYGNMPDRKKKIESEGFNYNEIQQLVNKLSPILKGIK